VHFSVRFFVFFVLIFTDFVFASNSLVRATSKHFVNGITGMYLLCNRQQRSCGRLCCYFSQDWPENAALFESHIACVQCMWSFLTNVARNVVCVLATPVQWTHRDAVRWQTLVGPRNLVFDGVGISQGKGDFWDMCRSTVKYEDYAKNKCAAAMQPLSKLLRSIIFDCVCRHWQVFL